jgi:RNA polymerase sigma-70 factor (ECF subfamily)
MQRTQLSERELVTSYMKGDEQSFVELLNRSKSKVYTSIYLFVKDHELANDIFQDTYIKIIDTLRTGKYNEEGKFQQWALRIAYNLCIDHFRRNKRVPTVAPTDEFDVMNTIALAEDSAETCMIKKQTFDRIRLLVDQLPAEQREVVILRHYADLSFKEIADLTHVSINTALGRMRYALINIRKMISEKQISLQ